MRLVLSLAVVSLASALVGCAPEGSSAYVSVNVPPDDGCVYSPTSDVFISRGLFDIGATTVGTACKRSYFMHLVVNSNLKPNARDSTGRAEPNVLQIMEADVRLMDKEKNTLNFKDKDGNPDSALPNPFRVQTANSLSPASGREPSMGMASIEAIPRAYASKLSQYNSDNILIEVQIFGVTTGDVDIDFKPFIYPVNICQGCLSKCLTAVKANEDPYGEGCVDNAAADGRYCIDPSC